MATTNANGANAQVNEVKNAAMQVENTNAQVVEREQDTKDAQKVLDLLLKGLRNEYAELDTLQGQRGLAVKVARELGYDALAKHLNSVDCLVGLKQKFPHLCFAKLDKDGKSLAKYIIPCKFMSLAKYNSTHKTPYADHNAQSVIDFIGDKSLKANKFALVGYQHEGSFVACTSFAELRHDYTLEVVRMVDAYNKKGEIIGQIAATDDEGKVIKDAKTELYVPVLKEGNKVQRKAFMNALVEYLKENALSVLLSVAK